MLGDLFHLLGGYFANLVLVGSARSLRDTRSSLKQNRSRRSLGDEGERGIAVNGHHDWDDQPFQFLLVGAGVELFAELHDVDLRLTKRRSYRRCRSGFARCNL